MKSIIILLSFILIVHYVHSFVKIILAKKHEYNEFVVKYTLIKFSLIKKYLDYFYNKPCPYSKIDDAKTLANIIQNKLDSEKNAGDKNPSRFYKKLYKEFKKEKDFQTFINKHFIGIANFMRCYGDDKCDLSKELA